MEALKFNSFLVRARDGEQEEGAWSGWMWMWERMLVIIGKKQRMENIKFCL